jgi:hypothetical protein
LNLLEIKVTDAAERLLMEQTFKNLWDRKSKPEIVAIDDWDAPVNIEVWEAGQLFSPETFDKVQPHDESLQMDISQYIGERET